MKNFLEELFKNIQFRDFLFNYEEDYIGSYFEEGMAGYSNITCKNLENLFNYKKDKFIAENTQWIFIDTERNLYGALDKFIVISDNEGTFSYFCNGFENIPLFYFNNIIQRGSMNGLKEYFNKKNISLENLTEEYKEFGKRFNIEISWSFPKTNFIESTFNKYLYNEDEFNKFIKQKVM